MRLNLIEKTLTLVVLIGSPLPAFAEQTFVRGPRVDLQNRYPATDDGFSWNICNRSNLCANEIAPNRFARDYRGSPAYVTRNLDFSIEGRTASSVHELDISQYYSAKSMGWPGTSGEIRLSLRCNSASSRGLIKDMDGLDYKKDVFTGANLIFTNESVYSRWRIEPSVCPENSFKVEAYIYGQEVEFGILTYGLFEVTAE